jgi:hypothetical protein
MRNRPLIAAGLIVALYVAWPYATLLKLRQDLQSHDVQALQGDIDWGRVRAGLKDQIRDSLEGRPAPTAISATSDDLPPFGASFAAHIAGTAVDNEVTPQRVADAFGALTPVAGAATGPRLEAARFSGLTTFVVTLRTASEAPTDAPVRLKLALVRHGWQFGWEVTSVWMPASLLEQSQTHAS